MGRTRMISGSISPHAVSDDKWVLRVSPYQESLDIWNELRRSDPAAGLYHSDRWLSLLRGAFRLNLVVATIARGTEIRAGCMLATSRRPFTRKLVALPFCDKCTPLSLEKEAVFPLMTALSGRGIDCEVRGISGPAPWDTAECFQTWSIDLKQTAAGFEEILDGRVRRKIRRAKEAGIEITRDNSDAFVERYYALHAETRQRLGMPSQAKNLFRLLREAFSEENMEIWMASRQGIDVAGLVLLRNSDQLHYKWAARRLSAPSGTQHMLICEVVNKYSGTASSLDLGRTDIGNAGLNQFKKEVGGVATPLPYAFFPKAPRHLSAENLGGSRKALSEIWKHLPSGVARGLGGLLYPYLA
jgi:hypothetical protein